jgi:hypothetical protein
MGGPNKLTVRVRGRLDDAQASRYPHGDASLMEA